MSLRTRLLILVIAAMLVPAILVGLRFVQNRASEIDAALANLAASADDIASDLNEKIQGTAQLHYGLARARDLDTRDKAACSAFLSDVREEYPQFTGILTIDPDGSLFCDSLRTNRTLDLNDRGYFKQVKGLQGVVAVEPVFGRLTGLSVLQIAYPVRSEAGALKFVLLASFNLNKFAEFHDKRLLAEKDILLVDAKGTVLVAPKGGGWSEPVGGSIAGSDLFRFAAAPDGEPFREVTDRGGRTQIWGVARSPSIRKAGLTIMVGRSKDGLVAAANRRLYEDMAILAVALLLLLAGLWILTTVSIGRQVGRLATMAKRLGRGDLSARIPEPHPGGELGGLMTLLNGTAESLEQQRAAIADLNQKLSQSQKMEAMGQLTGGVAHDFNNLLTVILGNSEHLADQLAGNKELHRIAGDIATAAERGSDLTRSLLAFARKQPLRPREIDIAEKVLGMEQLLRRTLGEHIECRFAFEQDLWPASVDPGQLTTALLNLVLNARDAMPEGGKLTVEVHNSSLGESDLDVNGEPRPGDYVMVAVTDTGSGMTSEVASRAFEPFFTTKEVGKGTGLGLSMVYGFARQSGGLVQMQSEPGRGSVIRLFFPRLATPPGEDLRPAEATVTQAGHETILLVEDDDMVRAYVESELRTLGYRVVATSNGPAALEVLRQPGDIQLLFTDVVMPGGMFGPELAKQATELRPDLKVLFTSGYSQTPVKTPDGAGEARILTKPFRRKDLAAMLRSALASTSR
ncbi:ATP-binding protein [Bradyrhizobium sp. TM233]|uniref:ATP-binding protein n=1 Tax=Bradyrhizobium sp. TM233 TaxID=2599801 RepID=UPI0027D742DB|nr:ATP-binding protein [Bradyrhizobium sp. TM233]